MIDALLVAALISTVAPGLDASRRDRYAADIAAAVSDSDDPAALAAALVVTQKAESDFRETVETCKVTGDNDRAITAFQLHPERWQSFSRAELCADNGLAARVAADFLAQLRRTTGSWTVALTRFVGCSSRKCAELRGRDVMFFKLLREARKGAS